MNDIIQIRETISLQEVYTGKYIDKRIQRQSLCSSCKGTGSDDGILRSCRKCQGRKTLIYPTETGTMTKICDFCQGFGINNKIHLCPNCQGHRTTAEEITLKFLIPVGVEDGEIICIKNEGNIILGNNKRGEVQMQIQIDYGNFIKNDKYDLKIKIHIPLVDSLCGFSKLLDTPKGNKVAVKIDEIIKPNDLYLIENSGLPQRNNKNICGKLCIEFLIDYPEELSTDTKEKILMEMKNHSHNDLFENKRFAIAKKV